MRRTFIGASLLALMGCVSVAAHDLFLNLDSYFLAPNSRAVVRLMNGTFMASEGRVARERLALVSVFGAGSAKTGESSFTWHDEEKITRMEFETGGPATYLVALSTKPRELDLKAADFNDYLSHDGLPDTLAQRRQKNELNKDVRERYSKHVRAIFQVGTELTDDYKRPLNQPVEIIPQQNPYSLKRGDTISVLCLKEGKPVANQFVMAGWDDGGGKAHGVDARSDRDGIARIKLIRSGKWFIKFIHMTPMNEGGLNYESRWASLTFEIK